MIKDYLISWPCIYWWMLQLTNSVAATSLFIQFTMERSVFTQSFIHKKFHLEWVSEQLLNVPLTHNRSFRGRSFQAVSLHWYWQQKYTQNTENTKITQNKHQKTQARFSPPLMTSGNGEGIFLFGHFINVSRTYLHSWDPHGAFHLAIWYGINVLPHVQNMSWKHLQKR